MSDRVTKKNRAFEGVRLEVTTSAGFDVVLDRLRDSMGRTSISEIVELVFRLIHLIPACTFQAPRQPWDYPRFNGILINVTEH
jgi:hypothetical protein